MRCSGSGRKENSLFCIRFIDLVEEFENLIRISVDYVSKKGIKEKYLKIFKKQFVIKQQKHYGMLHITLEVLIIFQH